MNGVDCLADTNALIYLLNGNSCMFPYLEKNLALSIISAMELLSFSGMTETESQSTRAFINDCTEITLSNDIKEKTIEIRKKYRTRDVVN